MTEIICSLSHDLPEPCRDCNPCIMFGCEHVNHRTARRKEEIVRCKDCRHFLEKGYAFDEFFNAAEKTACNLFSNVDFDYDYESFWYVKPDDFCKWGERQ